MREPSRQAVPLTPSWRREIAPRPAAMVVQATASHEETMTPNIAVTIKLEEATKKEVELLAQSVGYSRNQFIVEAIHLVIYAIRHPEDQRLPKLISLTQRALEYEKAVE